MSRAATGSVQWIKDCWRVRISDPVTGKRPWIDIEGVAKGDEETARALGSIIAKKYRAGGAVNSLSPETFNEWVVRWLTDREAQGLRSVRTDTSRLVTHIQPVIGRLSMKHISRADIEHLVTTLDERIRAGEVSWKTVANAWALVTKAFDDACHSKNKQLRCREENPTSKVRPPDRGAYKAKTFMYPSECTKVLASQEVPLYVRQTIALATYLYARRGELAALTVGDVDLDHGFVSIHSAEGENTRKDGTAATIKTAHQVSDSVARTVPIEPALMPLLAVLCEGKKASEKLIDLPHEDKLSGLLREALKRAGVKRPALFVDAKDATRKNMTFHDCRSTGITWMAARGDPPLQIMQRAGHTNFQTTQRYIRTAEPLKHINFGVPFAELPPELYENVAERTKGGRWTTGLESSMNRPNVSKTSENTEKKGCAGGDLKTIPTFEIPSVVSRTYPSSSKVNRPNTREHAHTVDNSTLDNGDNFEAQLLAMLNR